MRFDEPDDRAAELLVGMYKSCSRCGKIHPFNYNCKVGKKYDNRYKTDIDKLRNKYSWEKKSKQIREESNYLCAVCADKGIYNYRDLEVHHIISLKENPNLLLDNENHICLCWMHHKMADNGDLDAEYLRQLARRRKA